MTASTHKVMSMFFLFVTICIGALIMWSQPEQWVTTSIVFALLCMGLWYGLRVKRKALTKTVAISEDAVGGKRRRATE
jgi:C4-dicarboxylate transporter